MLIFFIALQTENHLYLRAVSSAMRYKALSLTRPLCFVNPQRESTIFREAGKVLNSRIATVARTHRMPVWHPWCILESCLCTLL